VGRADVCAREEWCHPERGCEALPDVSPSDASTDGSSPTDAGDASIDVSDTSIDGSDTSDAGDASIDVSDASSDAFVAIDSGDACVLEGEPMWRGPAPLGSRDVRVRATGDGGTDSEELVVVIRGMSNVVRAWDVIPIVDGIADRTYAQLLSEDEPYVIEAYINTAGVPTCEPTARSEGLIGLPGGGDVDYALPDPTMAPLCTESSWYPWPGDADWDGCTDDEDLARIEADYLMSGQHLAGDVNRDGTVNLGDLGPLRLAYCTCAPAR
jgi:hypothetical protein